MKTIHFSERNVGSNRPIPPAPNLGRILALVEYVIDFIGNLTLLSGAQHDLMDRVTIDRKNKHYSHHFDRDMIDVQKKNSTQN
jgi:hypothetical protein